MSNIKAFISIAFAVSLCSSQSINISGVVKDSAGVGISGAVISLEKAKISTTTAANGSFLLSSTQTSIQEKNIPIITENSHAFLSSGNLNIVLNARSIVEVSVYNVQGRILSSLKKIMPAGFHLIALSQQGAGVYLLKLKIDNKIFYQKGTAITTRLGSSDAMSIESKSNESLLKKEAVTVSINDVISVKKDGQLDYRLIIKKSDTTNIEIKMIPCEATVTDADENVYQAVRIGNQLWTTTNLRTTKLNDGTPLPCVSNNADWFGLYTPGYCFYNNTANVDSIKRFGALYNWFSIDTKKLAPSGWHVPTAAEWDTLKNCLIAKGYNWDGTTTGNKIARSLAAKADWFADTCIKAGLICCDLTQNNKSGFSALPAGSRRQNGFFSIGSQAYWWSATEYNTSNAYHRYLSNSEVEFDLLSTYYLKIYGFSVRLVKD
jgi:uncharacterized protein (TIGR02145 family)